MSGTPALAAAAPIGAPGPNTVSRTIPPTVGGSTKGRTTTPSTAFVQRDSLRASQYASGRPNTVATVALIDADSNDVVAASTTVESVIRARTSPGGTDRNSETSGAR